jgi:MFS family permease
VRSLPLHLNLFHPDRAGGLGFLSGSVFAFAPVLVAQTVILAGFIGDRIWHAGAHLPSFELEILAAVVFLVLIVLAPLSFFVIRLENARQDARGEYGILASHYVDDFHRKWIEGDGFSVEPLLGTQDIQSLSDLGNSYNVVSEMRLLPFNKRTVLQLAVLVVLPLLPLVLTMVPLHDVLERLIKVVF